MPTPPFKTAVRLRSEQTGGAISVVENTVPAGWEGPPLHHHAFDEAFYVLDGELTFQLGDDLLAAGAGTLVFAPGDSHHTLANLGAAEARYLLMCTPAGFERYFDRLAAEQSGTAPPPEAGSPVPETVVIGPPIDGARPDLPSAARATPPTGRINVLVRGEDGHGRIAVMENVVPAGAEGPPLHHHDFDELFWILDGELTFQLGDELLTRGAGEFAFAPRGAHHTYTNLSDAPARTLLVCTPASFERYFARLAAELAGVEPPAWALQPTPPVTRVGPRIAR